RQVIQGVGTFVAPLLASRVFFANTVDDNSGLKNVQYTYLGVACFVSLLIVLFWLIPCPEVTDADQEALEVQISDHGETTAPFKKQYNLFFGVWSQFCYVEAQVAVAGYFINFCKEAGKTSAEASDFLAIAQGLYTSNRFVATSLMLVKAFKPRVPDPLRRLLGLLHDHKGIYFSGDDVLVLCFESMTLRGLGRYTKRGGSLLVTAISCGMVFPPRVGVIVTNKNAHIAMTIPMMDFFLALVFPIYVNIFNKDVMGSHQNTELNVTIPVGKAIALVGSSGRVYNYSNRDS
ncbi:hypothetical protein N7463_010120, partial [Penicillium fimorum]